MRASRKSYSSNAVMEESGEERMRGRRESVSGLSTGSADMMRVWNTRPVGRRGMIAVMRDVSPERESFIDSTVDGRVNEGDWRISTNASALSLVMESFAKRCGRHNSTQSLQREHMTLKISVSLR